MYRIFYPINANIIESLNRYDNIKEHLDLPSDGKSDLEIVRLLDNQHYLHIKKLTQFINELLPKATEIASKIIKAKDPFELEQYLAELYLYNHLYKKLRENVKPKHKKGIQKIWDISTSINKSEVRIEIFTPIELASYQNYKTSIRILLKFMDLPFGYDLHVQVNISKSTNGYNPQDLYYSQQFGSIEEVHVWLKNFHDSVKNWLQNVDMSNQKSTGMVISGPGGNLEVRLTINELSNDPNNREISIIWPTSSSDTELFFSVGEVEDWARWEWGRKIKKKMFDQQCGPTNSNYIRILVINFALADSGWPNFISEESFTTNFESLIRFLVNQENPYDIVIPAQLNLSCCFGYPVSIKKEMIKLTHETISLLGMDTLCKPMSKDSQQEQIDELIK